MNDNFDSNSNQSPTEMNIKINRGHKRPAELPEDLDRQTDDPSIINPRGCQAAQASGDGGNINDLSKTSEDMDCIDNSTPHESAAMLINHPTAPPIHWRKIVQMIEPAREHQVLLPDIENMEVAESIREAETRIITVRRNILTDADTNQIPQAELEILDFH